MIYLGNLGTGTAMTSLEIGGASAQVTYAVNSDDINKYSANDIFIRPAVFSTTLFSHR